MAVRNRCLVGAAVIVLASCSSPVSTSPTPPPGMAVVPKAQVLYALDRRTRADWKTIAPHVRTVVLESTAITLVDLVEYASTKPVVDPYKDNFRYVLAGDGYCDVEETRIAVAAGDLVVAPIGASRDCKAHGGTLVFLAVSLARGRNRVGLYEQPPPAGRIKAAALMDSIPDRTQTYAYRTLYDGLYGEILAAKIAHLDGLSTGADEFVYIQSGQGAVVLAGRRSPLRSGAIFVAPANTSFSVRATGRPLEALIIRANHEVTDL
jgi:mannose-6-phosphate isomerase-like protein (cupin superfamily)